LRCAQFTIGSYIFGSAELEATMPADQAYTRRVLLAVTGLSPQIVTETLYALAVDHQPVWIPTEIRIITDVVELGFVLARDDMNVFGPEHDLRQAIVFAQPVKPAGVIRKQGLLCDFRARPRRAWGGREGSVTSIAGPS
jgi:hypothetical protein